MKKILKKSLALILALVCVMNIAVFTASAATPAENGAYGNNPNGDIKWTLDSDGTLTVKGKGEMEDMYNFYDWTHGRAPLIKKIVIEKGITRIGNNAFSGAMSYSADYTWCCENLQEVKISDSVVSIGDRAFTYASQLKAVYYDGTKKQWENIEIGEGNEILAKATVYCKGDINRDGKTNSTDALMVLQHSVKKAGYELNPEQIVLADVHADSKINSTDALEILKISVGSTK